MSKEWTHTTIKPLTLEQLQGMRGKWVWIVSPDKDLTVSGWAFVGKTHVYTYWEYEEDALVGRVAYNIFDYGAWLAYSHPPIQEDWLIAALKRLKVVTGSLACQGCGYEHNCGIHGCALIHAAIDRISGKVDGK